MLLCMNRKQWIVHKIKYGLLLAEFLALFSLRLVQGLKECCREKPDISNWISFGKVKPKHRLFLVGAETFIGVPRSRN